MRETLYVTLANGTKVPFDEFEKWSDHRQRMYTIHPIRNVQWGVEHSEKMRKIVKGQYASGSRPKPGHLGTMNGQSLGVITPKGTFETLKAAAKAFKVEGSVIHSWVKDRPTEFRYLNPISDEERMRLCPGKRAVKTPDGVFETINSAARYYGVGARTIKTWIRTMRKDEFSYAQLTKEK